MDTEFYLFGGVCEYKELPKLVLGYIELTRLEEGKDTWNIKGIIEQNIHDKEKLLEGFISITNNPSQKDNIATLILLEHPLRKNNTNTLYSFKQNIPKNQYLESFTLDGTYLGKIYTDVKIKAPGSEVLKKLPNDSIPKVLFSELIFDENKGYYSKIELEYFE
jgi:hypothetical protein